MSNDKLSKAQVSYVHWENTQYQCRDCPMWIEGDRCLFMGPQDIAESVDSCNYFVKGMRASFGFAPLSLLIKEAAGWSHNDAGFSCKRCEHWDEVEWKCSAVDENSAGLDYSLIHPDACCNLWEPDSLRSGKKTEEFYTFG